MQKLITILLLLFYYGAQGQEITVSGVITDGESGETLIGATIATNISGTSTNEYGFYSLRLPASDSILMTFSYVGFQATEKWITSNTDIKLDIELYSGLQLDEVVVKANSFREQLNSTEMSVESISTKEAKVIPVIFGETDIIKTIQLKPGITSGSEGSTGLFVRGGSNDQNLIVLDEAIVYNPNHLFGFFSTFNADAIKDVKVYKGGFPAQYGGRLSSVIDVRLKEGNKKEFAGAGGIGLIASRLTLEGPIQKDKSSFIVTGRRTYADIITRQINNANEDKENYNPIPDYYFYDLNTKVNFILGEKDHLYLSGYFGRDVFNFQNESFNFSFDWGNATGTARWNHVFNPKLFANTTFTYSDYQYNISNKLTGFSFNLTSNIEDANLKSDFYYAIDNENELKFGANITYHHFVVGRLQFGSDDGEISFSAGQDFDGIEYGLYGQHEWTASEKLKIAGGLRISAFTNDGNFDFGIEPRVSARYIVSDRLSVKGSYARMKQYLHLISNSSLALPTDVWYPSTKDVQPQTSDQVAAGFSYLIGDNLFLTNEYYYKYLDNQIDFADGANLFANDKLEQEFVYGDGYAYGMELGIEKKEGKLKGWIGYTLAWIRKGNFTGYKGTIMEGRYYPPRYDRRHDLSVVAIYELNRRWTFTSAFIYGSGDISWMPSGRLTFSDVEGGQYVPVLPVYGDRNNFRLPPYHRLDLGIIYHMFPKWGESDLTLSIYNTYDRRNPYFVYIEPEVEEVDLGGGGSVEIPTKIAAKQVSLFPILPSLTWNFKF